MWAAISRIEKEFAANRTGRTAEIYASYAPRSDVISGDGIPALTASGAVFSAAVIFWIGIWGFRALTLLNRKQSAILPR